MTKTTKQLLIGLILLLFIVTVVACGSKDSDVAAEDPKTTDTKSEEPEKEEPKKEEPKKEEPKKEEPANTPEKGKSYYEFMPNFPETVIYEKDSITITAKVVDDTDFPLFNKVDPAVRLSVKNNSSKEISLSVDKLILEDGFELLLISPGGSVAPNSTADFTAIHVLNYRDKPQLGDYVLYQDYGMGNVLGDFQLDFVLRDEASFEEFAKERSPVIKTDKSGTLPDYSNIVDKPTFFEHEGIKLYHLETAMISMKDDPSFDDEDEIYFVLMMAENPTDQEVDFNFTEVQWNEISSPNTYLKNFSLAPQTKRFESFYISKGDAQRSEAEPLTKLTFTINLWNENNDLLGQPKTMTYEFPQPIPYIKSHKTPE